MSDLDPQEKGDSTELPNYRIGPQVWRKANPLRKKKILSPRALWMKAKAYFAWADEHPWRTHKYTRKNGTPVYAYIRRPYTEAAFMQHSGVSYNYWQKYIKGEDDLKDHKEVAAVIKSIIRNQKIEGAMVREFDASIVSKVEGLVDKVHNITPLPVVQEWNPAAERMRKEEAEFLKNEKSGARSKA